MFNRQRWPLGWREDRSPSRCFMRLKFRVSLATSDWIIVCVPPQFRLVWAGLAWRGCSKVTHVNLELLNEFDNAWQGIKAPRPIIVYAIGSHLIVILLSSYSRFRLTFASPSSHPPLTPISPSSHLPLLSVSS